ncbi:hypothetical protein DL239_21510, partial [Sedimentitalea sp. CY04]
DQGVVTPTYNLSGSGLVVTPEIEQGEVVPTYMLSGSGLEVTPEIGAGVVTSGEIVPEDLVGMTIIGSSPVVQIFGQSPPYSVSITGSP